MAGISDKKEIRMLQFSGENVDVKTAQHTAGLFNELMKDAESAREWRGRFSLDFPDFDSDNRPAYAIPEVRRFITALDAGCPHMIYFLMPDPAAAHIMFYLLSLIPAHKRDDSYQYSLQNLMKTVESKIELVGRFCQLVNDDEEEVSGNILINLPPELLVDDPDLSARALVALRPILDAMAHDFDSMLQVPNTRRLARTALGKAATLLHIDYKDALDRRLLKQVILKIKGESKPV